MNYKISIITVCYNSSDKIETAIKSVIEQKYADVEYIIIDGGSTDGTQDIICKYSNYISYWCSEVDNGIYDAMNKGINQCTGDIVAFLNSDDYYEKDTLIKVGEYFQKNDIDLLFGCVYAVKNNRIINTIKTDFSKIDIAMPCCHQGIFSKREVFSQIGVFDTKYKISADYDWVLRAYKKGFNIKCVSDILAYYGMEGISSKRVEVSVKEKRDIALKYAEYDQEYISKIKLNYQQKLKNIQEEKKYKKICNQYSIIVKKKFFKQEGYYIWGTGYDGEQCYELFKFLDILIIGFIDSNKKDETIYGIPVFFPDQVGSKGLICIATNNYEKEIIIKLKEMNIEEKRIVNFSQLKKGIVNMI